MLKLNKTILLFLLGVFVLVWSVPGLCQTHEPSYSPSVTIICYMNGDNDLSQEVLHTVDMMEAVGSSQGVNVVALVDGHPQGVGTYGNAWSQTRLLHLQTDAVIGRINSPVIAEWGEADLGSASTLETFVRTALQLFPADRYIFYTFAHSQGIIETKALSYPATGKVLSISRDTTSKSGMGLDQFHQAIYNGLGGRQFDVMVMFSCLTGMMEVGYTLSDITDYLVASEDEIRLLNQPPGAFQIRGLKIEEMIKTLHQNPAIDTRLLGRRLVDSHFQSYYKETLLFADQSESELVRYAASMALLNCESMPELVRQLDLLANKLIANADNPDMVAAIGRALNSSQQFASFLNMEYYDLADFIGRLMDAVDNQDIITDCTAILTQLKQQVVVYERHTKGRSAAGLSIYLSNPLVPQNIFEAHQAMYRNCRFSLETQWDEWIGVFRNRWNVISADGVSAQQNQPYGQVSK